MARTNRKAAPASSRAAAIPAAPASSDVQAAHRFCAALDAFRRGHGDNDAAELLAAIRDIAAGS